MSTTRFGIFPCTIDSLELQQIGSASVRTGANKEFIMPGGSLDVAAIPLNMADPTVTIGSHDFTTILGGVSISAGLECDTGGTFRYQKRADQGTFAGSTSNLTLSSTKGMALLRSIGAQVGSPATISLEYKPLWDGSTLPLVINNSVSFSGASQPAFGSVFYLGPMYVNSTQIEGVISTSVDPGLVFDVCIADGDLYPRVGSIIARRPSCTVTLKKAEYMATMGNVFNNNPATTVKWYFLKGAHGTTARVSAGTAEHCKISATAGAWNPETIDVQDVGDAAVQITFHPVGTLAASVASAVP